MVGAILVQHAVERGAQLTRVLASLGAGAGVEHLEQDLAEQVLAPRSDDGQVGRVHAGVAQVRGQQGVGIGRRIERGRKVRVDRSAFRQFFQ